MDDGAHPEKGRTTVKRALKVRFTVQVTPKWIRASLGTRNMCLTKWTTTNRLGFVSLLRLSLPAWLPPCQHITSSLTDHQLDILRDKSPAYTERTGIFFVSQSSRNAAPDPDVSFISLIHIPTTTQNPSFEAPINFIYPTRETYQECRGN